MTKYYRKTRDVWILQGYSSSRYGWEDLTSEDWYADIRRRLKEYQENEGGRYRIIRKRVKVQS